MKKILIIVLLVLTSCGYQSLYSKKDTKKFAVKELQLIGNKEINKDIISSLSIEIDEINFLNKKIILENNKQIIETSRDSKGQPDSFKMIINLKFIIENKDNIKSEKVISEEFSYKNKDNKFDLSQYESEIETNLTKRITDKLIIYLNL